MKKNSLKVTFSKNLVKLRKNRGISQGSLSQKTGLSQRVLSSYENNIVAPPLDNIEAIANALNVKISDLLETEKSIAPDDDYLKLDSRTTTKIKLILSLPRSERHVIYNIAEAFIAKRQLEKIEKKEINDTDLEK